MTAPKSKDRFSRVKRRLWNDRDFRQLSAPAPNAQTLWLRLLTGPELSVIPGLIPAWEAGLAQSLRWPLEGFREAFGELFAKGWAKADWEAGLVWLPKAPAHNPPESPNVVKAWAKAWAELPECDLKNQALLGLKEASEGFPKAFRKAFEEAFREAFAKVFAKTSPNQEERGKRKEERKRENPQSPHGGQTPAVPAGGSEGGQEPPVEGADDEPRPATDPPEPSTPPTDAAPRPSKACLVLKLFDPNEPPPPPANDDAEVPMPFRDDHTLTLPGLDTQEAPGRSDAPPSRQGWARRASGTRTRGEVRAGQDEARKNDSGELTEVPTHELPEETTETQRMGDDKARYAKHFAIGVRSVTGDAGFALMSGEHGELADICIRRGKGPDGKALRGPKLDAWLEQNGAAFARETAAERKWNPLNPRGFEKWFREKAEGKAAPGPRRANTYHGMAVQSDECARRERARLEASPNPNTLELDRRIAALEAQGIDVIGEDLNEVPSFARRRAAGAE
ncbi:MAG: hypothetical protein MUF34_34000 [Polyangiaceae bacterium]|nr:hypothetical protein [Polyangiaceae bacterium]